MAFGLKTDGGEIPRKIGCFLCFGKSRTKCFPCSVNCDTISFFPGKSHHSLPSFTNSSHSREASEIFIGRERADLIFISTNYIYPTPLLQHVILILSNITDVTD